MNSVRRFEANHAVLQRKQREITALPDKMSRKEIRAFLPHENASRPDDFAAEALDSQTLGLGVPAVL